MKLEKDTVISHYKILSKIGKGGMGEVYLANDTKLDRKVAIKFLSEEFSEDIDKLNRFIQEAKAASALNHPNILTVFEIGEFENNRYIVNEHIEGKTISEIVEEGSLNMIKAIDYAIQITSALAAAHDAGIVHRDIKAGNVMVRKDGIVKLLDFGLAKLTYKDKGDGLDSEAPTLNNVLTVPGMLIGTPTYMSPEQARGKKLDVRTDIFSFGILLFEMLTGKRPFVGESYADIMGAILKDEPPPLSRYLEDVPPELEHILAKTLRKEREQRYQNIKDLLIDLQDLQDDLKFEAKLSHSSQNTRNPYIHNTGSIAHNETVQISTDTKFLKKFSYFRIFISVAILAFLTIGIWLVAFRSTSEKGLSSIALEKKDIVSWSSAPGELFSNGEFSPDGKMVAYASARSGSRNIWIKQTVSGEAVQVTKDEFNNQNPLWSPTGNEIAFFSERGSQTASQENSTGIWRIPTFGGTPVLVTPVKDGSSILRYWSKSGKIYYESNGDLFAVNIETGKSEQVTKLSHEESINKSISISSDEKQIAYGQNKGNVWNLMVMPVSGGTPKRIVESKTEIGSIVWHPENERILYSAFLNGAFQIFAVSSTDTAEPVQLTFTELNNFVTDVSDDGSNILVSSAKEESNLWQIDVKTLRETSVASGIDSELWASISAENEKIAYQSVKNLSQGNNLLKGAILVKESGLESQPLKVTDSGFLPIWASSGQQLAFMRTEGELTQIWAVKSVGSREIKLTKGGVQTIGYSVSPYNRIQTSDFSWSPDSRKIAYISERNGVSNVWVVATDGSGETNLTGNNDENLLLYCPVWNSDGSKLAFYTKSKKPDREGNITHGVWTFAMDSKESKLIAETGSTIRLIGWSADESGLVIASPSKFGGLPPETFISEVNLETGGQKTVITLKDSYYYNIRLSPDGNTIAYVARLEEKDDVWMYKIDGKKAQKLSNNNDSNLYFSSLTWSPNGGAIYFGKQTRYSLLSMLTNFK